LATPAIRLAGDAAGGARLPFLLTQHGRVSPRLRGLLFYDRDCRWCRRFARLGRSTLARHGFALVALQSSWSQRRLALAGVPEEMKLLLPHGQLLGGARALVAIIGTVPWGRPLAAGARLAPVMAALDACYRFVAAHRGCRVAVCASPRRR
jgi:predicted DCC family thiol-disulfide oxidoreductase YuxK